MSINCIALGKRICFYRLKFNITQEKLAALTNCSREYIAYLESGTKTPSLPTLIDLANVLHISVDDLLVDSLDYSFSTSGSDLHRLLLDCNQTEQEIIIRINFNSHRIAFIVSSFRPVRCPCYSTLSDVPTWATQSSLKFSLYAVPLQYPVCSARI